MDTKKVVLTLGFYYPGMDTLNEVTTKPTIFVGRPSDKWVEKMYPEEISRQWNVKTDRLGNIFSPARKSEIEQAIKQNVASTNRDKK